MTGNRILATNLEYVDREGHFHLAKVDNQGNGETVSTKGNVIDDHTHKIGNFIIFYSMNHCHSPLKKDIYIPFDVKELKTNGTVHLTKGLTNI